jgi:hypothetical protein
LSQSVGASAKACGSIGRMRQQEDWYAYLNIATDAPTEQVGQAVERLSRQATALAVTAPERSQRLRDTVRSIKRDLLSGPEARTRYDAELNAAAATPEVPPSPVPPSPVPQSPVRPPEPATIPPPPSYSPSSFSPPPFSPPPIAQGSSPAAGGQPAAGPPASGSAGGPGGGRAAGGEKMSARLVRFLRTGWVCGECGKEAVPSDKFCTRCGTVIIPTRHDAAPTPRVTCASCAAPMGVNDVFCARCGARASK